MTSPLVDALTGRHGYPLVDERTIDAFLAPAQGEAPHTLLFFTGDAAQRSETNDVAVVMPEIVTAFQNRLRGAVVDRSAEAALKDRFHVAVFPSLVVTREADPVAVLPKIQDWSDYIDRISACLLPDAPVITGGQRPRVTITHTQREAQS